MPALPNWLQVRNAAPDAKGPVEICIYDEIGQDWFGDSGVDAQAFVDALREIPATKEILVCFNSPGGNVYDGLAIYHALAARRKYVTARVDGLCASIASIIAMAASRIQMCEGGRMMIHDPFAMVAGNAEAMRKAADQLDAHGETLAGIYARRIGKTRDEVRTAMKAETWYNADEARAAGLCDDILTALPIAASLKPFDLARFKPGTKPPTTTDPAPMNRNKVIASLNRLGIAFDPKTTDETLFDLLAAFDPKASDTTQVTANATKAERERLNAIRSLYDAHNCGQVDKDGKVLTDFLAGDKKVEDLQNWILQNCYKATPANLDPSIGMSKNEVKQYSMVRAISMIASGKQLDGLEREASDACAKKIKRNPEGFFIPHDVAITGFAEAKGLNMQQVMAMAAMMGGMSSPRAGLTAGSAAGGGYTVGTDVLTGSLIELLRNKALVMSLGARNLSGLVGDVAIPRHTGGATAYWLDETTDVTLSTQTLGQLALTPHRLGAATAYTKQLLAQSSLDIEGFVRQDLMTILAIEKDRACLNGLNASGEPLGIINTTGIGSVTFGAAATWAKLLDFETQVANANADMGSLAYLSTPNTRAKLKAAVKIAASQYADFLWEKGDIINGYPARATLQVPSNKMLFGNWNDLIVADWDGIDLVVDNLTLAKSMQIQIIIHILTDNGVRHVGSFCVSSDSAAQ